MIGSLAMMRVGLHALQTRCTFTTPMRDDGFTQRTAC
jgi:hypothetical protein